MNLNKIWNIAVLIGLLTAVAACSSDNNDVSNAKGQANIYITDAPVDDANISAVVISINSVEAKGPGGWQTVKSFEESVALDLLNYQNGEAYLLTEEELAAGSYSEVRLILDIEEENGGSQNPASYIGFKDGSKAALFVPSGGQSGYKAKGDFTIPVDGSVSVTLDFDVRKALVKTGNGDKYILKPTVRLIANEEAGVITGTFEQASAYKKVIVFAYAEDSFNEGETSPPASGEVRFANAISSSVVSEDKNFTLAFMESGKYDLYFAVFDENGEFVDLIGSYDTIDIEAGAHLNLEITLDLLN